MARYRADGDLRELTDVWPPDGGQVVVEPLDGDAAGRATYRANWYADDEEVCVWPVDD